MDLHHQTLTIRTRAGLCEVTEEIRHVVAAAGVTTGLCVLFLRHTSASLVIQENADPSARADLEAWLARLAPEGDARYTHTTEGPDDMPAHLRAAVTRSSETIPIVDRRLALGAWQGIYVWEHRRGTHRRDLVVTVTGI